MIRRSLVSLLSLTSLVLASCADAGPAASIPASPATSSAAAPATAVMPTFTPAFTENGHGYVVLDAAPDLTKGVGAPRMEVKDGVLVVVRDVTNATNATNDGASPWLGAVVRLQGATGTLCEGVVHTPRLVGRVMPHDGTLDRLQGKSEDEAPLSPEEAADEGWSLAAESAGVVLAGEVDVDDAASCVGALWAMPAELPAPELHASTAADPDDERRYLSLFRALPAWDALQGQYLQDELADGQPHAASWDVHGEAGTVVNVIALRQARLVVVTADVGEGCGDFSAHLTAVFREDARGVTLVGAPLDASFVPSTAGDVDGDGAMDLVMPTGVRRGVGAGEPGSFEREEAASVPFLGCGC